MLSENNRVGQAVKKRHNIIIRGTKNTVVEKPMQNEKG